MAVLPLARHGVQTSRLILGCMAFGGGWNREAVSREDIRQAEQALDAAISVGITMLDTADIYTLGKSELTLGTILKERPNLREQFVIQSKCGIRLSDSNLPTRYDFSKQYILEAVDGILQRLQMEYLDILLLHRPDPLMEPDEVGEAFGQLKASGKVRYFGVSNMSASQIRFLQTALPDRIVANQLEISLSHLHWLDQTVHVNQAEGTVVNFGEGLLEHCRLENIQIQAWSPLSQGRFSGRAVESEPENIRQTAELVKQLAANNETTPEAIVLAWLMKHPALIQPVIGTINSERILACQDAERQAALMSRNDWYRLYVAARGKPLP
jgi:predicted oxidoreductase